MLRTIAFVLAFLTPVMSGLSGTAAQPAVPGLFIAPPDGTPAPSQDMATRRGTLRARHTAIDMAAFDAPALELSLFPGSTVRAELDRRSLNPDGSESWSGRVAGEPLSAVTFVQAGTTVQGSIRVLDAAYSVEPLAETGLYEIRQVDLSALGTELPPRVPVLPAAAEADGPVIAGDDGTTFDVLVVYTAAARTAAGGTDAAIQNRITLGMTETNTAYANSGVIPRLRLVGTQQVTYTESGNLSADLDAITRTADGHMDSVHALRNSVGADLVQLVVGSAAGGACGVAWLMQAQSAAFAPYAFSVTAYPCISPNYTFGHELGHNMGSNHAPEDQGASTPMYAYSFGYKHPAGLFRTVMAYDCQAGCPRVLHFSNPLVNYGGSPTGTAASHNNGLSINNARSTIANWRQAAVVNTPPTITGIANQTINEDAATAALPFTIGDAQTAAASLALTATSSNVALVPNTSAALALGGSGASRTIQVTPQPNASGSATITLTVSDGALLAATSFVVVVNAVNDAPAISAIGAQTGFEDQGLSVSFTVSDVETAPGSLLVTASSSTAALIGQDGLSLTGAGASRVLTLTPRPDQSGSSTITVAVSDGMASTTTSFVYTVVAVNDAPVVSTVPVLVSTSLGVPVDFAVTVTDVDTPGSALALSVASTNTVLLPQAGIAVAAQSTAPTSRTFRVTLTPAAAQSGSGGLVLTASDGAATATASASFNVTPVPSPPDAPTAYTATADGTTVTMQWVPALTGAASTSYLMEIGTAPGTTTLPTQSVPAPATMSSASLPAGTYYTRVRAVNGVGTSAPSPEVAVTVVEPSPIPGPPGNFSVFTTGTTVVFAWTAPALGAAPTGYVIEAGSSLGASNLATLHTGGVGTAFSVANVAPGTYWVRVRAVNAAGTGAASQDVALVMGSTDGCVGLPANPVLLTPVVSGGNVTLSWNAPASGRVATNYVLMAGSSAGASDLAVFATGSAATSFAASAPDGLYFVRVAAANACGTGPVSNEVSFTLGADRPVAPSNLAWSTAPDGRVVLSWEAPASGSAPTTYLVEAGSGPGLANLARMNTGSTTTSFVATAPGGIYFVRVRAVTAVSSSAASNEVIVIVP